MSDPLSNLITPKSKDPVTIESLVHNGVQREHCFAMPGWHIWCGSIQANPEGGYAFFFSRWPDHMGHNGWVTHSEICRADGPAPWGPFTYAETILTREESDAWDAHNFHNVTVKHFAGRYYLYFTGNRGDGEWWTHRNNQRIGVAVAESLKGPWVRGKVPVIDTSPDSWDSLCVANPSVTEAHDGRYMMIYKGVSEGPRPFGGRVMHGMAFAENPAGPFTKLNCPVFDLPEVRFPFEDPYIWKDNHGNYYCLMKDMEGVVAPFPRSIVLFHSEDGLTWNPRDARWISSPHLISNDGSIEEVERLERPHYFSDKHYSCVSYAVKPFGEGESFIVFQKRTLP